MIARVDVPLLVFGVCSVLLAGVLAYVGESYRPESTPLIPARPAEFGILMKSFAVGGALLLGLGAAGFGGLLVVAVTLVALGVARL